jgi:hypothetical protein
VAWPGFAIAGASTLENSPGLRTRKLVIQGDATSRSSSVSRWYRKNLTPVPVHAVTARRVRHLAAISIVLLALALVSPRLTRALGILSPYGADWLYLFILLLGASSLGAVAMGALILRGYRAVSLATRALGAIIIAINALMWALLVAFLHAGPM